MTSSFRDLHAPGRLLVLPNAWDAGSARLVAACGAEAVATTSAGLSWSRGYPDGNALPLEILQRQGSQPATSAASLPLTATAEHAATTPRPSTGAASCDAYSLGGCRQGVHQPCSNAAKHEPMKPRLQGKMEA